MSLRCLRRCLLNWRRRWCHRLLALEPHVELVRKGQDVFEINLAANHQVLRVCKGERFIATTIALATSTTPATAGLLELDASAPLGLLNVEVIDRRTDRDLDGEGFTATSIGQSDCVDGLAIL